MVGKRLLQLKNEQNLTLGIGFGLRLICQFSGHRLALRRVHCDAKNMSKKITLFKNYIVHD